MRIDLIEEIEPDIEDPEMYDYFIENDSSSFSSTYYLKYISDQTKDRCSETITY